MHPNLNLRSRVARTAAVIFPLVAFRPVCAAVVFIGTSLLLQAGAPEAQAAEIRIVSPSDYEPWEGEGGGGGETSSPFRFQQLFPAEDFSALGNQPHWLVGFTVRPDQSVTSPRTAHFPDQEVRLSTTQRRPDDLSLSFADNLGPDVMQFYRGSLNLMADIDGTSSIPREFYHAEFPAGVTPYLYDPSHGNLLFDVIAWQGASPSTRDDEAIGMLTAVASSPTAMQGHREEATIFQFTFVPVTPGDYNASGTVEQGDLDLVLLNWGRDGASPPAGWVSHLPTGAIDQAELDGVLLNWGNRPEALGLSSIPEPSSFVLLVVLLLLGSLCPRASKSKTVPTMPPKLKGKKKYWQTLMACGLLVSLSAAAQADIFRWDNGQLIPGSQRITPGPGVDLSSPTGRWSSPQRNLHFADFSGGLDLTGANFWQSWLDHSRFNGANLTNASLQFAILTNADLSGTNLTDAELSSAILTNANLSGAVVNGAQFYVSTGFTEEQFYSTASYQQRDLRGIRLGGDLTGWDFNGQDLTGAGFYYSRLTSANFAGALIAGANFDADYGGTGITLPQLYSTASYQQRNLRGIGLYGNDLTGADFSGQDLAGANLAGSTLSGANLSEANLTNASLRATLTNANLAGANLTNAGLYGATLTNANLAGANLTNTDLGSATLTSANFAGALVRGANFQGYDLEANGITLPQLYSTASYQEKNLRGIGLSGRDLTGWDFSGQDLTGAIFYSSTLRNTNFSFADLRGARLSTSEPIQLARNTIRESGAINGLDLAAGETLVVRNSEMGITVNDSMNAISGGTLELVLDDAEWGSTLSVAAGVTPDLGGTLRVRFADQANLASMVGTTFNLFDWPAALEANNRFDAIELPPGTQWDFSQLYATGAATFTAIPEPSAILLLACVTTAWILGFAKHPGDRNREESHRWRRSTRP